MIAKELGKILHDKVTRGVTLSGEEQMWLQTWYDAQDTEETDRLVAVSDVSNSAKIQAQIDAALIQLLNMTRRIQEVMLENEALRQEIEGLRRQLVE